MHQERIATIDGLRFLSAFGVLWIHVWTFYHNPRWFIGKIDIANLFALGGNGVDMFFVISGFCMYYFYASKTHFNYTDFYRFIKKRWVRLSPAFYASAMLYIIAAKTGWPVFFFQFLHSVGYLNFIAGNYTVASHFWTLTVEWQFYFIIPLILIYQQKFGFNNTFILIFGSLLILTLGLITGLKSGSDFLSYTFLFRIFQFAAGIIVARLVKQNKVIVSNRVFWLILFVLASFAGRAFISNPVLELSPNYHNMFKLTGFALLGAGFGGILLISVTSERYLLKLLGNNLFKELGKTSYSFYLLHALFIPIICNYFIPVTAGTVTFWKPLAATIICALGIYPFARLSYTFLEKPFLSAGNLTTK